MTHYIPANMYSWEDIAKAERLNVERVEETARRTHEILRNVCRTMDFPSEKAFAQHYNNVNSGLITDRKYNQFFYHGKLEKIAHLIKWVLKDGLSTRGNKILYSDFAILKSHYDFYKRTGKAPIIENRGRVKEHFNDPAENARTKIDIPKNPIYRQFAEGIKAANAVSTQKVTIPQMTLVAMQMLIDSRPDVFGQLEQSVAPDSLLTKKSNSRISADISPETTRKMNDTIQRYNSANAVPITQSQFVELAINGLIERIDVKYSDPELAEELKEQEK